ncbi:hypothetical protein H8356DRAFT_1350963 [Neocallimastix lanati (nom. inval.)]|nr:hypothetical protein H8356DRAFT_1350963 [Neocallimastix sp. JGI-2020a]
MSPIRFPSLLDRYHHFINHNKNYVNIAGHIINEIIIIFIIYISYHIISYHHISNVDARP